MKIEQRDSPRLRGLAEGQPEELAAGRLVAEVPSVVEEPLHLAALWPAIAQGLPRTPKRSGWRFAGFASGLALASVLGWLVLPSVEAQPPARVALTAGRVGVSAGGSLDRGARLETSEDGLLILGLTRARALVGRGSVLTLSALGRHTALALRQGRVISSVDARQVDESFRVEAVGYVITVKGTVFSVDTRGSAVSVSCARGEVEVSRGAEHWRVPAGTSWRSADPAAHRPDDIPLEELALLSTPMPPADAALLSLRGPAGAKVLEGSLALGPLPVTALISPGAHRYHATFGPASYEGELVAAAGVPVELELEAVPAKAPERQGETSAASAASSAAEAPGPEDQGKARPTAPTRPAKPRNLYAEALDFDRSGNHREAARLLRTIVDERLPNAELALYHLAELEQHPLGAPDDALRHYLQYQRLYPQGTLSQEAELSAIELELQRHAFSDGLAEIDVFLRDHPRSERAGEIRRLRESVQRTLTQTVGTAPPSER